MIFKMLLGWCRPSVFTTIAFGVIAASPFFAFHCNIIDILNCPHPARLEFTDASEMKQTLAGTFY